MQCLSAILDLRSVIQITDLSDRTRQPHRSFRVTTLQTPRLTHARAHVSLMLSITLRRSFLPTINDGKHLPETSGR